MVEFFIWFSFSFPRFRCFSSRICGRTSQHKSCQLVCFRFFVLLDSHLWQTTKRAKAKSTRPKRVSTRLDYHEMHQRLRNCWCWNVLKLDHEYLRKKNANEQATCCCTVRTHNELFQFNILSRDEPVPWMDSNFHCNFRRCCESLHLALPSKRQKQRQVGMYCYDSLDYSTHTQTDDRALALALRTAAKRKPRKLHFIDTQSYRMHRIRRRPFGFPLQWFEYIYFYAPLLPLLNARPARLFPFHRRKIKNRKKEKRRRSVGMSEVDSIVCCVL